mmetsp:Transcript_30349/g.40340  ORF Transcript_30349/g.40340 Transcript_30349/m.40340 type:complete len:190 (+) Transcript_30349:106-675(+)
MLNKPLPAEESTAATESKSAATPADDDSDLDNDGTAATADTLPAAGGDGDGDEETAGGKKKKRKRANKRTVAKLKELRKEFIERCVSPSFHSSNRIHFNGNIQLTNLRDIILAEDEDAVFKNTRSRAAKKNKGPPILLPKKKEQQTPKVSLPGVNMDAVHPGMLPDGGDTKLGAELVPSGVDSDLISSS